MIQSYAFGPGLNPGFVHVVASRSLHSHSRGADFPHSAHALRRATISDEKVTGLLRNPAWKPA
jgi:hypothetical protein